VNMQHLLTRAEKEIIRRSPCGVCGAIPILEKGELCEPHRIVHGCNGGLYTRDNAVPRCPSCHDVEHGGDGTAPFVGAARASTRKSWQDPKKRIQRCKAIKKALNNPKIKARHIAANKKVHNLPDVRLRKSEAAKKTWTTARRKRYSRMMKERWIAE